MVFAVGAHTGGLRRAISRYKYRGERGLAPVFAGMIAQYLEQHPTWFEEFHVITGVPSFVGEGARRRWDPVGAVLAALPARLGPGWSVEPGLVVKGAETPGMTGAGWGRRQVIGRGPLRRSLHVPDRARVEGAQVLVVDDVFTEGSTLHEVARRLRRAGASDVAGLVLARPAWEGGSSGR